MEKESASKYQEIVDYLTEKMQSGAYREHDRLPTEQELPEQFEVSRPTVVRAMEFLRSAGLVYRIQGKGTFAASDSGNRPLQDHFGGASLRPIPRHRPPGRDQYIKRD
mgnify:CR=1 FL=1